MVANNSNEVHQLAMFVDLENLAIGVRDAKLEPLNIQKILGRLVEKGELLERVWTDAVVKEATVAKNISRLRNVYWWSRGGSNTS